MIYKGLRRYVSMNDNKRYRLFKLFLIFTILNILGIILYENIGKTNWFRKKPEFYVEGIKPEDKELEDNSKSQMKEVTGELKSGNGKTIKINERKILIIGDSNVYLMSKNKVYYNKKYEVPIYWLAESGAKADFISEKLNINLGKFMPQYIENSLTKNVQISLPNEIKEKGITDAVILLGVNSLGELSAKNLSKRLISLSESGKVRIHYVSLLPYVDKSKYKIKNKDIISFNKFVKEKLSESKINYIDVYDLITSTEGYKNETADGLHYSKVIYDKVLEKIMDSLMQNN